MQSRLTRIDALAVVGLFLAGLGSIVVLLDNPYPQEDAAMLLRYARHLAGGHGIVWNVGEDPVEGATDFLLVVVVALLERWGIAVTDGVRLVGSASHLLTVLLVYLGCRVHQSGGVAAATAAAGFLVLGPAPRYVEAYFGTPFFGLFVAFTFFLAQVLRAGPSSVHLELGFAIAGLLAGLARPEGVLLFALVLLALVLSKGAGATRRLLAVSASVLLFGGGLYFIWRFRYFGYLLPNPYYVKGGGVLHFSSLAHSYMNLLRLGLPFLAVLGLASLVLSSSWWLSRAPSTGTESESFAPPEATRALARELLFAGIPLFGFASVWLLLSNQMNYLMRFQYALLPILLLSWLPAARFAWRIVAPEPASGDRLRRAVGRLSLLLAALGALSFQVWRQRGIESLEDGRYHVALMLRDYRAEEYTMAVTEAGLLPFLSEWNAIDVWGLNDEKIAHDGPLRASRLDETRPELIMFHADFSPVVEVPPPRRERAHAVRLLSSYAAERDYVLAASYGISPYDTHYYYVRRDFADSDEIARRIRETSYSWEGADSVNYAALVEP